MQSANNTKILNRKALISPIHIDSRKPRILFDQDDVLFDLVGAIVDAVNKIKGTNFTVEDVTSWNMAESLGPEAYQVIKEEGFFANLQPKKDAVKVFKRMYESGKYDCRIVTSAQPYSYAGKVASLIHMPFFDLKHFIACSDKSSVWGDVLIDDGTHNVDEFQYIGKGIMYHMPHNKNVIGYDRVYCLAEAEKIIEDMFYPENQSMEDEKNEYADSPKRIAG